jgi:hypothetical protein
MECVMRWFGTVLQSVESPPALYKGTLYRTDRKMGLILRFIERMLKMQFSMAHKFTLQPLRRYDVKPPKKTPQA